MGKKRSKNRPMEIMFPGERKADLCRELADREDPAPARSPEPLPKDWIPSDIDYMDYGHGLGFLNRSEG